MLLAKKAGAEEIPLSGDERTKAIIEAAKAHGIPPAVALAVFSIESGGAGFSKSTGKMIIRFEPNIFRNYHTKAKPATGVTITDTHAGQSAEWAAFDAASLVDAERAMESISMGGPQVMGFNFATLGYTSVKAMFDAFSSSEDAQIAGFFAFVEGNGLTKAAQTGDWLTFARGYNGKGQKGYDKKLEQKYNYFVGKGYPGI